MNLIPGAIVRTNYGTGPFRIKSVLGPCTCPRYSDFCSHVDKPSPAHFHLVCDSAEDDDRRPQGPFYLNGYRDDGSCVWSGDRLIFEGVAKGTQLGLFEVAS